MHHCVDAVLNFLRMQNRLFTEIEAFLCQRHFWQIRRQYTPSQEVAIYENPY